MHRILHMLPNCVSRKLGGVISKFTVINPTPLYEYQLASMLRFAHSDENYFRSLADRARELCGDSLSCASLAAGRLPDGAHHSPPVLNLLLDALELTGRFQVVRDQAAPPSPSAWLLASPLAPPQTFSWPSKPDS